MQLAHFLPVFNLGHLACKVGAHHHLGALQGADAGLVQARLEVVGAAGIGIAALHQQVQCVAVGCAVGHGKPEVGVNAIAHSGVAVGHVALLRHGRVCGGVLQLIASHHGHHSGAVLVHKGRVDEY